MTRIDSVGENLYRIHTPISTPQGGFSFNQYLLVDDEPLLYHTGPRALAPAVLEAIGRVMPIQALRWVSFGHVESDECGGLNTILAAAPAAAPVCGQIAAMVSVADLADRPPRALADGEILRTGRHELTWLDAPHLPHGWDNGFLFERTTATLFAGDLFTQPGTGEDALIERDILGPSEAFRAAMDYYAHAPGTAAALARLAALAPRTLACMHGSAWRGDGGKLLGALAQVLTSPR